MLLKDHHGNTSPISELNVTKANESNSLAFPTNDTSENPKSKIKRWNRCHSGKGTQNSCAKIPMKCNRKIPISKKWVGKWRWIRYSERKTTALFITDIVKNKMDGSCWYIIKTCVEPLKKVNEKPKMV